MGRGGELGKRAVTCVNRCGDGEASAVSSGDGKVEGRRCGGPFPGGVEKGFGVRRGLADQWAPS